MKNKIRVAFFSDTFTREIDGVTRTVFNIVDRIPRDRFSFMFIAPRSLKKTGEVDWPVIQCPAIKFPFYKQYQLVFPFLNKELSGALKAFAPDIIHFTTPSFLGWYAMLYGRKHNIPVVNVYHTHFPAYLEYYFPKFVLPVFSAIASIIMRGIYTSCSLTLAPSRPIRDFLIKIGVSPKKIAIWKRGVDIERFSPQFRCPKNEIFAVDKNSIVLLFVGRLVYEKGIETLVRIYTEIMSYRDDVRFVVVGNGPRDKYLKKKMPHAIFTGKITGEALSKVYASSDIFIFPSRTETFGNVVLEALASGNPVIAAREGGPVDIVSDGINGYLVPPKDKRQFVDKIKKLINNPEITREMAKSAHESVKSESWDDLCNHLFNYYERLSVG